MKHIGFLLLRMNFLYSFIPLAKYLQEIGNKVTFVIPKDLDNKENSLLHRSNYKLASKLILSRGFNLVNCTIEEMNFDSLFVIEGHGLQKLEKELLYNVIYIQNFCDFSVRAINKDSKHVYKLPHTLWLQNDFFYDIAKQIGHQQNTLVSLLPGYWEYENETVASVRSRYRIKEDVKLATCFLPRATIIHQEETHLRKIDWKTGHTPGKDLSHAIEFAGLLASKGYKIILKQRQKNRNQDLVHLSNYVEDLNWYPFTSMDLSFMSDLCYGYMSMSILDVAVLGGSYINIEKNEYPEEIHTIINKWYNDDTIVGHNIDKQIHLIDIPDRKIDYTLLRDNIVLSKEKIRKLVNENC